MVRGVQSVGASVVLGALLFAGSALAQQPPPESVAPPQPYPPPAAYAPPAAYPGLQLPAPPPRENSVNGSPLGAVFGNYSLNYERLVGGTHGFLIEGVLSHSSGTATNGTEMATNKSTVYGAAAGYRWHWSGQQQSGFLGLMAGYTVGSGTSTITSTGSPTTSFDMTIKAPWVVGNIGKRWQWDSGINITFRIGAGYAKYTVTTSSTDPQAMDAVKFLNDLLTLIPVALDGELSLGYSF